MHLDPLATLELQYTRSGEVSYESSGQVYGDLEGKIDGPMLQGTLRVTNLATRRPDGNYTPALRGILTTHDGATMYVTLDGLSILEEGTDPPVRVGLVSMTFRTADPKLVAWIRVFAVAEYGGKSMGSSWGLVGTIYRCVPGA
jgi:hypothetical protein